MKGIVQLDVVRTGLVKDEEFPQVRLTNIVSYDTAPRLAAQILAVESLEGEPLLFLSSEYRLHFEFLPGEWLRVFPASDLTVIVSLEPSLLINIKEGVPFGAEGSLEATAGISSLR